MSELNRRDAFKVALGTAVVGFVKPAPPAMVELVKPGQMLTCSPGDELQSFPEILQSVATKKLTADYERHSKPYWLDLTRVENE